MGIMDDIRQSEEAMESINSGDYHQAILDVCYEQWQKRDDWDYANMVLWAKLNYGSFVQFMVLMGKTNQQVTNGGFSQLFDNGYADGVGGCFSKHTKTPLHSQMIRLMSDFGLDKTELGSKVDAIMCKAGGIFRDSVKWDREDDMSDPYEDLDREYYDVCDKWMEYLNQLAKDMLNGKEMTIAA